GSKERRDLRELETGPTKDRSFLALVAAIRNTTPAALLDTVRAEVAAARDQLAFMAEMLQHELELPEPERASDPRAEPASSSNARRSGALDRLVTLIERNRRSVEDSV